MGDEQVQTLISKPTLRDGGEPNASKHVREGTAAMSEQEATSQRLLRGIQLLWLSLPPDIAAKVVDNYAGMMPMERFLSETLGGAEVPSDMGEGDTGSGGGGGEDETCASCRATVGTLDNGEAEH